MKSNGLLALGIATALTLALAPSAAASPEVHLPNLGVGEADAAAGAPLQLAETARRLGLHRSTAHHIMQTLVALGWLRQDEHTRCYALSARPYQLTDRRWSVAQIGDVAQPLLERLTHETGEGTSVAAWVDGIVTIAAKREHDGPVRVVQDVGGERPIYCTAVGKAIAGWLPAAEVRAALPKAADAATRRHLEDTRVEIASALDPQRLMPDTGGASRTGNLPGRGLADWERELPPIDNEWTCSASVMNRICSRQGSSDWRRISSYSPSSRP